MLCQVKNFVKNTGSQISNRVFSLTSVNGFESLVDGDTNILLNIFNPVSVAPQYCFCLGDVSGSTLTVSYVIASSDNFEVPTFTGAVSVISTSEASIFEKQRQGVGGLVYGGQSNSVATANGRDALKDFVPTNLTQFKFRYDPNDPRGTNYDEDETLLYQEPIFFNMQGGFGANTVGSHLYFGRWLLENGHKNIRLLPCAEGGTAFGANTLDPTRANLWRVNDPLATRMKDMIVAFINEDPENNYLAAVVWMHGESDHMEGMDEATYAAYFDALKAWVIAQVAAETTNNYDMSRVPWILPGMPQQIFGSIYDNGDVQSALQNTPTREPYTSFVDVSAFIGADPLHHNEDAQRWVGSVGLPQGYMAALKNHSVALDPIVLMSVDFSSSSDMTANLTAEGGNIVSMGVNFTSSSDMTANLAAVSSSATPLTDALNPIVQLRRNVGLTLDASGNVTGWEDQSVSNTVPIFTAGANFNGTAIDVPNAEAIGLPAGIMDTTGDLTFILKFKLQADADDFVIAGDGDNILFNNTDWRLGLSGAVTNSVTTSAFTNDVIYTMAITGDVAADTVQLFRDGTLVDTNSTADLPQNASANNFNIGINWIYSGDLTVYDIIVFDSVLSESQINDVIGELA